MSKGKKRKLEKQRRRAARRDKRSRSVTDDRMPLSRTSYVGKARSGDLAVVSFQFSGLPVPFAEGDPPHGLKERTAVVRHLGKAAKGRH